MPALSARAKNALTKKAVNLGIDIPDGISDEGLQTLVNAKEAANKALPTAPAPTASVSVEPVAPAPPAVVPTAPKTVIVLKDTYGRDVPQKNYFYSEDGISDTAPDYFNKSCGYPVDREDLLTVFNRVFKDKGFLFYKDRMKEVYITIIPIKYAKTIGKHNDSRVGDFQRHALSFLQEGGVNTDTLRMRLEKIASNNQIGKDEE